MLAFAVDCLVSRVLTVLTIKFSNKMTVIQLYIK